jgi:hypothetical protein
VDWYHDREFIANMPAGDQKLAAELLNIADRAALVVAHPPPLPLVVFTLGQGLEAHALPSLRASEASSFTCTFCQPWFAVTSSSFSF